MSYRIEIDYLMLKQSVQVFEELCLSQFEKKKFATKRLQLVKMSTVLKQRMSFQNIH